MVIFNSYVSLPEGILFPVHCLYLRSQLHQSSFCRGCRLEGRFFFSLRVLQWQCNGKLLWNLWHRMARLFFLLFTWCNIRKGVLSARTTLCFPKRSQELLAWDTLNSKDIPYTLATLTGKIWKTIFQKGIEHAGCLQSGSWILYSKH